eukprot:CAMPEP_0197011766 /NCGR_PEP_ID=MMETSP1380-20130617/59852_1 /TAXON_ID=5936 /ORGANISM="Euplotes crassus, Strain CT5" /LENGTH=203 /DNA_ID=CAMNT_0042434753 /DNA_START=189 /DNA_END=801 /DNA_ORIENTATION=+
MGFEPDNKILSYLKSFKKHVKDYKGEIDYFIPEFANLETKVNDAIENDTFEKFEEIREEILDLYKKFDTSAFYQQFKDFMFRKNIEESQEDIQDNLSCLDHRIVQEAKTKGLMQRIRDLEKENANLKRGINHNRVVQNEEEKKVELSQSDNLQLNVESQNDPNDIPNEIADQEASQSSIELDFTQKDDYEIDEILIEGKKLKN